MSRNMIEANGKIFSLIDTYCADRLDPTSTAGKSRWISTQSSDVHFLKNAACRRIVKFGGMRMLARFEINLDVYFISIGFEHVETPTSLDEMDVDAGIVTAVISELLPTPSAGTLLARDIIDIGHKDDGDSYIGHQHFGILRLFPEIRAFSGRNISADESWKIFFLLCVQECRAGESWINDDLGVALRSIADLSLLNVPYETLCRSIFDSDPAAMFLALYRCIESLYAYSSARKIINALDISVDWADVATALEDNLGWHPKEDAALNALMSYIATYDAEKLFQALGEQIPSTEKTPLYVSAGNRIYALRNGLVHYRPSHRKIDYSKVNWNELCELMTSMVVHIYSEVFPV